MKDSGSLRNFLTVLFKYKRSILWLWGATVLTILIGNQVIAPIYEAESTLMVNFGREYLYNPEVGEQTPYNYYDRSGQINSEIEILSSRELLEDVIREIGTDTLYPKKNNSDLNIISSVKQFLKKIVNAFGTKKSKRSSDDVRLAKSVDYFMRNLSIFGGKDSNVIRIIFQHRDPEVAAQTVNVLVTLYQKKHLQMFRDERVSSFLEDMVEQYQAELKSAEQQFESYKKERAANSIELQEEILVRQKGDFDSMLKERNSELMGLTQRLKSLQDQKSSMTESTPLYSETTERDRVIDNTKAKLLSLQLEEQELLRTYRESSSQIVNIRSRITLVGAFLQEQEAKRQSTVRIGKSMAYQDLESEIAMTMAKQQELTAIIESLRIGLSEIDEALENYLSGEQKMKFLERQRQLKEKNYLTYEEKLEEARINTEMDNQVLTNIKVIYKANIPYEPVKPKKMLNLVVGIILGGFFGIGVSFFRNHVNQGVNTPEILEKRLNLPVLATISHKGQ